MNLLLLWTNDMPCIWTWSSNYYLLLAIITSCYWDTKVFASITLYLDNDPIESNISSLCLRWTRREHILISWLDSLHYLHSWLNPLLQIHCPWGQDILLIDSSEWFVAIQYVVSHFSWNCSKSMNLMQKNAPVMYMTEN